jgi:hypothetical protein
VNSGGRKLCRLDHIRSLKDPSKIIFYSRLSLSLTTTKQSGAATEGSGVTRFHSGVSGRRDPALHADRGGHVRITRAPAHGAEGSGVAR